jgi:hypothetical protein
MGLRRRLQEEVAYNVQSEIQFLFREKLVKEFQCEDFRRWEQGSESPQLGGEIAQTIILFCRFGDFVDSLQQQESRVPQECLEFAGQVGAQAYGHESYSTFAIREWRMPASLHPGSPPNRRPGLRSSAQRTESRPVPMIERLIGEGAAVDTAPPNWHRRFATQPDCHKSEFLKVCTC